MLESKINELQKRNNNIKAKIEILEIKRESKLLKMKLEMLRASDIENKKLLKH